MTLSSLASCLCMFVCCYESKHVSSVSGCRVFGCLHLYSSVTCGEFKCAGMLCVSLVICHDQTFSSLPRFYLTCSGGDDSMFAMLRTPDLSSMAVDIISAVEYLQAHSMCHTDIATRHCQVMPGGLVKLAPFQFIVPTKFHDDYSVIGSYERTDGFRGARVLPIRWMAPESLVDGHFSLRSDIWSLGVTIWEIFSLGETPYRGFSTDEVVDQVPSSHLTLSTPPRCPKQLWKVVRSCFTHEPTRRPSSQSLLQRVKHLHANIARSNVIVDLGALDDGDLGESGSHRVPLTPNGSAQAKGLGM